MKFPHLLPTEVVVVLFDSQPANPHKNNVFDRTWKFDLGRSLMTLLFEPLIQRISYSIAKIEFHTWHFWFGRRM